MTAALAGLGAITLASIGALHVFWAFGTVNTASAAIPTRPDGTPLLRPGPVACVSVALLLFLSALLLLEEGGIGPGWVPRPWATIGTAMVALVLVLRGIGDFRYVGLFKRHRESPFARMDSLLYTPLVLALGLLAAAIVWLNRR